MAVLTGSRARRNSVACGTAVEVVDEDDGIEQPLYHDLFSHSERVFS